MPTATWCPIAGPTTFQQHNELSKQQQETEEYYRREIEEREECSLANRTHESLRELESRELKNIWLYPLGHAWGFETRNGVIEPPLLPVSRGKNAGLQFFTKPGIERKPEFFWRPARYPENVIDFICD